MLTNVITDSVGLAEHNASAPIFFVQKCAYVGYFNPNRIFVPSLT